MKLSARFKIIFWSCLLCLATTGSLFAVFNKWIRIPSEFGNIHHPLEQWVERSHTLFALTFLVVFGYFIKVHVEPGLKNARKRKMGLLILGFISLMPMTALIILYASEGEFHDYAAQVHLYVGLSLIPLILFHKKKEKGYKIKA